MTSTGRAIPTPISRGPRGTGPRAWRRGVGIRNPEDLSGSSLSYAADRLLRAGAAMFLFDSRAGADASDACVQAALAHGFGIPFVVLRDQALAVDVGASAVVLETPPPGGLGAAGGGSGLAVGRLVAAATTIDEAVIGRPAFLALDGRECAADSAAWASFCRDVQRLRAGCGLPVMVYGEFSLAAAEALTVAGADWIVLGSTFFSAERPTGLLRQFALVGPTGSVAADADGPRRNG